MARFMNGWVKLHRKIISEEWTNKIDGAGKTILLHLIVMANVKDTEVFRQGKVTVVKRGELITSNHELVTLTGLSKKTISNRLERLENLGTIATQRGNRGTKITLCNYNLYQDKQTTPGGAEGPAECPAEGPAEGPRIEEVKEVPKKLKKERKASDTHPLFEIWNANCGPMHKALAWSKSRDASANQRLKEHPDLEYWTKIVQTMAKSEFCSGKNDRGWKPDIDFLLRPDTHVKVLEGKYSKAEKVLKTRLPIHRDGDPLE